MRIRLNHKRLLEALADSKLSQNHWAIRLGLSRGHWSGIVKGKHLYPSKKTRERLLEVFDLPFEELFVHEADAGVDAEFQADIADRYLLDKEIAHGGMGIVYLARDVRLGRPVALKLISSEAVAGIGMTQVLKEIRYTARLQHHHILAIHDAGEAAGAGFYVMPYVEGGSLRDRLERAKVLSVDQTLAVARGIAAALQHAHDHQVLHCDIKPENVLLSDDHALVADFGIARTIHAEAHEWAARRELDTSAGTPAYVSPEQAAGERGLDARSDLYSFACVVFEMLAGRPPFRGRTTMEVVSKRFADAPNLRRIAPHVPPRVAAAVTQAMSVRREDRPDTPIEFVRQLERAAARPRIVLLERIGMTAAKLGDSIRKTVGLERGSGRRRRWWDETVQDFQYAVRSLRRAPGFAIPSILTLALGITANTAAFTVLSGLLLRPLPYPNANRLVMAWTVVQDGPIHDTTTVSPADFNDWRASVTQFQDLAAFNVWVATVSGDRSAEQVNAGVMTSNFFPLLGIAPIRGRGFAEDEGTPGRERVVLISHGFWQRWFGGAEDVLDRTLTLNGDAHHVIGVMPASYRHIDPSTRFGNAQFWVPVSYTPGSGRGSRFLRVVGRLREGNTIEDARAEIETLARQLETAYPETNKERSAVVVSLRNQHYRSVRPALLLVQAAAGFVLLLVCANVANLLLARGQTRRREFALRRSLGAGGARLARQLVVENSLLAGLGGGLGLVAAFLGTGALRATQDSMLSPIADVRVDLRVAGMVIVVSSLVGLAFGLLAAWDTMRSEVRDVLSEEAGGSGTGRRSARFRAGLIMAEVGVTAMLLIQAGLLTRSFLNLLRVPTGFDVQQALTFEAVAPRPGYTEHDQLVTFFERLASDVATIPGVVRVGLVSDLPFTSENRSRRINVDSDPRPPEDVALVEYRSVGPGYFDAMGIELSDGRVFTSADRTDAPPVVVVNEELVRRNWPNGPAIGQILSIGAQPDAPKVTVVGVVGDVLDDGFNSRPEPRVYFPYMQAAVRRMAAVIRTSVDPATVIGPARERLRAIDPGAPVAEIQTLRELVDASVSGERTAMRLAGGFSVLAILLAGTGIYGLLAYVVAARQREIGIRTALGAHAPHVVRLVLRQCMGLTIAGAAAGTVAGIFVARGIATILFGVAPVDPISLIGAPALLVLVALAASYAPARRALRVHPAEALRAE